MKVTQLYEGHSIRIMFFPSPVLDRTESISSNWPRDRKVPEGLSELRYAREWRARLIPSDPATEAQRADAAAAHAHREHVSGQIKQARIDVGLIEPCAGSHHEPDGAPYQAAA